MTDEAKKDGNAAAAAELENYRQAHTGLIVKLSAESEKVHEYGKALLDAQNALAEAEHEALEEKEKRRRMGTAIAGLVVEALDVNPRQVTQLVLLTSKDLEKREREAFENGMKAIAPFLPTFRTFLESFPDVEGARELLEELAAAERNFARSDW